jgi:tetratricopeptide (TPR) repeat protein
VTESRRIVKKRNLTLVIFNFAGLAVSLLVTGGVSASITCDRWVARMVSTQGHVEVSRAGQTQWQRATLNDTYCAGDRVQVGERSRADIALVNRPIIRLEQNTTITLAGVREERRSVVQLLRGALYFFSRLSGHLEVSTPFVNAGVEGTEGLVKVESDSTLITIFEGQVLASNPAGSLILTSGQSAIARQGSAPVLATIVRPRDAVQWALYYPPVVDFRPETFQDPTWQAVAGKSIAAYKQGDFAAAFESIKGVPDTLADPSFFSYRAALLLAVGRSDEARRDVERALSLRAADSAALALQAIIAVAQNDQDKALEAAQKAVTANPSSSAALIALSYAQQAQFDLTGARASLQQAIAVSPNDALAWARLAELHMSFADLDDALEAARKATSIDPNLSRTQTVLGFAYLTQVKTAESKKAFERAIELDQGDPLPRLGLGLALIREGDLDAGRSELDIAVSLDPDNSLLRSYLGKAYYEEKLDKQSADQYEMAKSLDPKDPTPYFYDAIRKQTTNRPVEALQDMQKAIELNDNRAVYRSRLELDSDLAARSASQARIYSDLGFQQLALVEGWKSVNTDPTNFSAHRFLADSYSILPRHEIARVSELLQSQLLQPINSTPVQPRLAESNLFLIASGGPAAIGFNEFNPLFNRDGLTFQTTGFVGENKTYAGEGVLSGIFKKASFSLGGFHFQTDGWRINSDQRDSIANAFFQFEFSPKTTFQFEYRHRNTTNGDLQLNFFQDDILPLLRVTAETETYRAGLRHSISPNSIILGSFQYQRRDTLSHDVPPTTSRLDIKEPGLRGFSGEIQHLFRSPNFNLVSGVGHFNVRRKQTLVLEFPPPDDFLNFSDVADLDAKHTNVYLYSNISLPRDLTLTVGASGDFFKTDSTEASESRNQFNPKLGITWNILPSTTIRAVALRAFKRTLLTNQTLEPTQVAGFNQFYDDIESTRSWRYGVAVDHKFSTAWFAGLEFSRRDLNVPIPFTNPFTFVTEVKRSNWREYLTRPYLFWTPHEWVAFSAEYQYERFTRVPNFGFGLKEATTHRVPAGVKFFHPSGLGFTLRATYVHQDGKFQRRADVCCRPGTSDFWLVDTALSYRLPKRFGILSIGATNLLDRNFKYQETDFNNPTIQPKRMIFGRLTLSF